MSELHNDIDKLFNQAFDDFEVEPSDRVWKNIKAALEEEKPAAPVRFSDQVKSLLSKFKLVLFAVAFVSTAIATFFIYSNLQNQNKQESGKIGEINKISQPSVATENNTVKPSESNKSSIEAEKSVHSDAKVPSEIKTEKDQVAAQELNKSSNVDHGSVSPHDQEKSTVLSKQEKSTSDKIVKAKQQHTQKSIILANASDKKSKQAQKNSKAKNAITPTKEPLFESPAITANIKGKADNKSDSPIIGSQNKNTEIPVSTVVNENKASTIDAAQQTEVTPITSDTSSSNSPITTSENISSTSNQIPLLPAQHLQSIGMYGGLQADNEHQMCFSGGFGYNLQIKKFTFGAGLKVSSYKSTFQQTINYQTNELLFSYLNVDSIIFIQDTSGSIYPDYQTHPVNTYDSTVYTETFNLSERYNYLEIPLSIGFKIEKKKWHLGLSTGVTYGFLIQHKQQFAQLTDNKTPISDSYNRGDISKSILKLDFSADITYMMNSNIGFTLQPNFSRMLRKPEPDGVKQLFGIQLGVGYYF